MKNKKSNLKSNCCNAGVRVEGMDDFDNACTMYHVCNYCNKPCDIHANERKVWKINPVTKIKGDERDKIKEKELNKEIKEIGHA